MSGEDKVGWGIVSVFVAAALLLIAAMIIGCAKCCTRAEAEAEQCTQLAVIEDMMQYQGEFKTYATLLDGTEITVYGWYGDLGDTVEICSVLIAR
jgi:hypothetical protein